MNKKRKILLVSYDYFPDNSPNTYRWHNIMKEWASRGHQIFVVAAQKPSFSKYEVADGIEIYRTGKSWLEILKSKLPKTVEIGNEKDTSQRLLTKESLIKKIYNSTFKQIYFPDFAFLWLSPGKKLASELIKKHNIKNVITVSWPFTDHLIGYQLQKKFKINWIADTIDPFYLSEAINNVFLYKNANRWLENKILSKASHVTVLTDKLKQAYIDLYPSIKNKLLVNHNIFIPYKLEEPTIESNDKIRLVFFGTLTPKTRSPRCLLKLMNEMDKLKNILPVELHIYGDTSQCDAEFESFQHLIGRKVFIHGLITKEQVKRFSKSASILVNIGNTNEYQEPSKIIEYVFLNKPILNICSIVNDSSRELLDKYPLNFNFFMEDLNDQTKITKLLEFISAHGYNNSIQVDNKGLLYDYLLPEVQLRYFNLLEEVVS